jgi:predicted metal-dependent hydrolase
MTLRIGVPEGGVVLVLPPGTSAARGLHFLAERRDWIAARLAALPPRVPFAEGVVVPIRGVPHRIVRARHPVAPPVAIGGGEIRVGADPLSRRVKEHLIALAREELGGRARRQAPLIGRRVGIVGVRDAKSRWGSCSAKGSLSFSWRLILAPERVLDYVVAHEVAHLAEMNHGPRFWRLVERLLPESDEARAWLKRHRDELFCYG